MALIFFFFFLNASWFPSKDRGLSGAQRGRRSRIASGLPPKLAGWGEVLASKKLDFSKQLTTQGGEADKGGPKIRNLQRPVDSILGNPNSL